MHPPAVFRRPRAQVLGPSDFADDGDYAWRRRRGVIDQAPPARSVVTWWNAHCAWIGRQPWTVRIIIVLFDAATAAAALGFGAALGFVLTHLR